MIRLNHARLCPAASARTASAAAPRVAPCRPALPARRSRATRQAVLAVAGAPSSTVKIILQGRKLPITDAMRQYVEGKIAHAVQRYQPILREINVTVSARGGDTGTHGPKQQKVEVTIFTHRNGTVRVEDSESDLYASIDLVCDKVRQKLEKVKQLAIAKGKWPGKAGPHLDEEESYSEFVQQFVTETRGAEAEEARLRELAAAATVGGATDQVVRSKELHLDAALSVEEAVEALEAIGHDFYVFKDKAAGGVQVLYRRKYGGYGLLVLRT